jgi:maltose alpha-D-glucosyltransferase/alpha-amylase
MRAPHGLPTPEALAAWLPRQRWFGAKSHRIGGASVADAVPVGPGVLLLADVELDGGGRERYAVPLLAGGEIRDALGDVEFCRALVTLLARASAVEGERGEIRGVPAAGLLERWASGPPADLTVRRIGGEQSNTSVVIGEAFMLKHFRKLADGVNPEAEVTRFLTEHTAFRHTPRLAGHLEYRDARGGTTTLAVLQALVPDAVDGWQWVLARLREPDGAAVAVTALRRLGECTGELHRALASDAGDAAFAPEPITVADVAAWAEAVAGQLAAARAALHGERVAVEPAAVRGGLAHLVGRQKIRHHGDFHLGQTLYRPTASDWMIIDFEGEPLRPLDERRRKHAAPRDVAGMLRSIDYAAVSALSPDAPSARAWQDDASRAFVEGYRRVTADAAFLPRSDAAFGDVVAVFELEKAAYEIVYEANNRPDWIAIPERGLVSAAARLRRVGAGAA